MSVQPPPRLVLRWLAIHLAVLLAIGSLGRLAEWRLMGWNDEAALSRVRQAIEADLAVRTARLRAEVGSVLSDPSLVDAVAGGSSTRPALFALLDAPGADNEADGRALTVYAASGEALAWRGRASDSPFAQLAPDRSLFVAPGVLGWRLVYADSILDRRAGGEATRIGTIVAEDVLTATHAVDRTPATSFDMPSPLVPVTLWPTRFATDGSDDTHFSFTLTGDGETPLLEARVDRAAVSARRATMRATTRHLMAAYAALVAVLSLVLLASRDTARLPRGRLALPVPGTIGLACLARLLTSAAIPQDWRAWDVAAPDLFSSLRPRAWLGSPLDLAATMLIASTMLLGAPALLRAARYHLHARLVRAATPRAWLACVGVQFIAGGLLAAILLGLTRVVHEVAVVPRLGAFEWPFLGLSALRLTVLAALMLLITAGAWSGVAILRLALTPFRLGGTSWQVLAPALAAWMLPSVFLWVASPGSTFAVAGWRLAVAAVAALAAAWFRPHRLRRGRRASPARQLIVHFAALLMPVTMLYPLLRIETDQVRRDIVANRYAEQVIAHPQHLQARLNQALEQIDQVASRELVEPLGLAGAPSTTGPAFLLWRRTVLATDRLTSAVELYGANAGLVSRFALNFPEYAVTTQKWQGQSCRWETFGETTPFGATERRMLHAERGICVEEPGRAPTIVAGIVVHVMLDYPVLPFISSPDPYAEFFRGAATDPILPDTMLVIYGWGRSPVYASSNVAWPLDDHVFDRILTDADRTAFWETRAIGGRDFDVYFSNDRQAIYAIGIPHHTWFDHFVYLSELITLSGVLFGAALVVVTLSRRVAGAMPRTSFALMAEIRRSFYRKLFLAFVAASVVPVIVLAVLVRTYVATRWRSDIEAEAGRTAAVAQRVIEESLDLQQAAASTVTLSDDVMVWIRRIIDQDVNIFAGPDLLATSERDLFESGLLPTRVSADVFKAIAVQRLPNYVGEDRIAGLRYLTAAVPIRVGTLDTILTVPLALRQQETERKIQELDRGVNLAALVFILLGSAGGFWMAERIGDPVKRLTRATRRLAAGDLSARAMVKSADELERLVEDFNRMAEQLALQRAQLERTHRLEAWADVARQVAHDIKNPLTPIQLSAEHLRRVNRDKGSPLSPVLESCVESILAQVRLLRRISSEFSTFASTPTARLLPTPLAEVLHEAVDPYESGLPATTRIEWRLDAELPELLIDRTLLGRALINVVDNALHAMPSGGTLTLAAAAAPDSVTIDITDTGLGMDADGVARIFEPYFSTKTTGTGLGLTIAKRNVEMHGGTIAVTSTLGAGTRVRIVLPRTVEPPN